MDEATDDQQGAGDPYAPAVLASFPSPSDGAIHLGPLQLRAYGLMIALGVIVAVKVASSRWEARGGKAEDISAVATWAVPAGLIGARLYHVATDYQRFQGDWLDVFAIWKGGLGIWGGVALGAMVGWLVARRRGLDATLALDAAAPAIALAQAIGRWGNWFNQELFGRPSTLPWAVRIDAEHRPDRYLDVSTFHPTFLYESLWNLLVVGLLLVVERRWRLRKGGLFALYVAAYTVGRFWIEALRVDDAHHILGIRLNDWTSLVVFLGASVVLWRRRPLSNANGEHPSEDETRGQGRERPGGQDQQDEVHG
jgi:prolipoprotein diacylglyceryl transferase